MKDYLAASYKEARDSDHPIAATIGVTIAHLLAGAILIGGVLLFLYVFSAALEEF